MNTVQIIITEVININIGSTRQKINIMFYTGFTALFLTTIYTAILTVIAIKTSKRVKRISEGRGK
ncbi:hypothetical protein GCM10008967_42360 [Bacillus carboniphilus]|uniref:Uncharacterized protein n=1 Tax=Bacillus carboniphilus TaxID=86663 RepID=A0ABN0WWC7_9BACI